SVGKLTSAAKQKIITERLQKFGSTELGPIETFGLPCIVTFIYSFQIVVNGLSDKLAAFFKSLINEFVKFKIDARRVAIVVDIHCNSLKLHDSMPIFCQLARALNTEIMPNYFDQQNLIKAAQQVTLTMVTELMSRMIHHLAAR